MIAHPATERSMEVFLRAPSHALAVFGAKGAGKTAVAERIVCEALGTKNLSTHPYVIRLDTYEQKIGIEEIREVQKSLTLQVPGQNKIRRAVIISNFDNLGHEAQNALLKTLEEPPADTILLLTAARKERILPTIRSRSASLEVLPITLQDAKAALPQTDPEKLNRAYQMSQGDVGLLVALLDQDAEHPLVKAVGEAKKLLAGSRFDRLASVDGLLKSKDLSIYDLLDGFYRILNASKKTLLEKDERHKLESIHVRMGLVQQAIKDFDVGVSAKLTLTRLFFSL